MTLGFDDPTIGSINKALCFWGCMSIVHSCVCFILGREFVNFFPDYAQLSGLIQLDFGVKVEDCNLELLDMKIISFL